MAFKWAHFGHRFVFPPPPRRCSYATGSRRRTRRRKKRRKRKMRRWKKWGGDRGIAVQLIVQKLYNLKNTVQTVHTYTLYELYTSTHCTNVNTYTRTHCTNCTHVHTVQTVHTYTLYKSSHVPTHCTNCTHVHTVQTVHTYTLYKRTHVHTVQTYRIVAQQFGSEFNVYQNRLAPAIGIDIRATSFQRYQHQQLCKHLDRWNVIFWITSKRSASQRTVHIRADRS